MGRRNEQREKDLVGELEEGELAEPLTFKRYPKSDMYLITLRNRVNREIARRMSGTDES